MIQNCGTITGPTPTAITCLAAFRVGIVEVTVSWYVIGHLMSIQLSHWLILISLDPYHESENPLIHTMC